jgi:predicted Zn-dependent peptidase
MIVSVVQKPTPIIQHSVGGSVLLMDPMLNTTGAAIGLWFPFGSAHETKNEYGLSHFVEHMVFKGAGDRDAEEISRVIDRVGGYLNAFTERETVCFHSLVPGSSALLAASVLLDMAFKPRLTRDEFEREKDVLINEILAADDDLEEAGQDEFFALTYRLSGLGRKIAGTVEDVREARFENLVDYHSRRFEVGQVIMTVAGNFDPKQILALFESTLVIRSGNTTSTPTVSSDFNFSRAMVRASGSQVYIYTGFELPVIPDEDYFWRLSVVGSAYGESMSSRLFMRIREKLGLCYSISSLFNLSRLAALWGINASTTPAQLKQLIEAYQRESEDLYHNGLYNIEIEEAKSRLRGLLSLAGDDPEYRMKRLARQYMFSDKVEPMDRTLERLNINGEINEDSVNIMIKSLMNPASENVLLYGKINKQVERVAVTTYGALIMEGK